VTLRGFLDDNLFALDKYDYPIKIVETIQNFAPKKNHKLIMAIANPKFKLEEGKKLKDRGGFFDTFIHPTVLINGGVAIGEGSVICPYSVISSDTKLGQFVTINVHSSIGHDVRIGDGCTISSHCDISGHCKLEEGVFLGSRSGTIPNITLEKYSTVAAGSTVMKKRVKANDVVIGLPAKSLKLHNTEIR